MRNYIIKYNQDVDVFDYMELRKISNLHYYNEEKMRRSLKNSLLVVGIYHNERIIGIGRVVGDDTTSFFCRDIAVDPEYKGIGIGKMIMGDIIRYCKELTIKDSYIGLMASKGSEDFYEKLGFTKRPNEKLGNGMVLYYEKE